MTAFSTSDIDSLDDDLYPNSGGGGYRGDGPDEIHMPMYSALTSGDTIRRYQQHNNKEEVAKSLPWSERLQAGYTGLAHGLTSEGPEQIYRTLRTLGKIVHSDDLQAFASEGIEREKKIRELDPYYTVPDDWLKDEWSRSLYEGMKGLSASSYSMLPGAAISLIPGGQVVGLASIGLGAGSMAGLAEYDSFMDEAYEKLSAINPQLTRKDIEDAHFWDAFFSGLAEGGLEAGTDIIGGKLIGLVGKAGVAPARKVLDQLVRNVTKTVALEAGSEVATAVVQDYIRENAGLDYQGRVNAFKNALGPALVGGTGFGVAGTGLHLAQGKIHSEVAANNTKQQGVLKAIADKAAQDLRKQYRESHYTPQAVSVFDELTAMGTDYVQASSLMEAVESTAKSWAERTGKTAGEWQGDANQVANLLTRLDEYKATAERASPEGAAAEALSSLRDIAFSELSPEQRQAITEAYGQVMDGESVIDTASLDADLGQLIANPNQDSATSAIPEAARPVLDSMRDSVLDLYQLANRNGLTGGFDPELSAAVGTAIEYRNTNKPKPLAFIIRQADLDNIARQYGDFGKLSSDKQTAMIKDMATALDINFDKWDMPVNQKAMFGFIDSEMKPFLDKLLQRGKRKDATQEALAKTAVEADGINLERFAEFTAQLTGNGDIKQSAAVKARELQIVERLFLEKTTELATVANESMSPSDILKWQMSGALHRQVHSMLRAVRSEGGHLLRAFNFIKKDPDLSRERTLQLFEAMGGIEGAQHRLQAYVNAETNADKSSVLSDSLRATTTNMFIEYRTLNMLSSVKTHVVNTAGNAGTLATEAWNRFTAEHMATDQNGVAKGETLALINGMWDGFRKVRSDWKIHKETQGGRLEALRSLNDMWGVDPSSSLIGDAGLTERSLTKQNALDVIGGIKEKLGLSSEHGLISNGMATMVDYMGRMLGISGEILLAQDQFFKTIAAHGEVAARNHREALRQSGGDKAKYKALMEQFQKNTPPEHKRAGVEFGKLVTYQTDLNGFAKTLNDMRVKHPLTKTLIPFFKTPVNIMKYAGAHTPGLSRMFTDINAQLNSKDNAVRQLAEARVMTGTFVWATVIGMAASGYLTGNGPTDDKEKEKARAAGWQPNSLKIGDTYIALDRLDPAAFLLNTGASLVEIYDSMDNDDLGKAMWAGLGAAFRVASDRTYLRSIADAVDAVTDWEGFKGDRARQGLFTSLVPASAMMRSIAQQTDSFQREIDGIMDAIRAEIPGMSKGLPVRRNFLGEAVQPDGYYGSDWLSPLRQSIDKHDPVYDEIYRLAKAGHDIPSMPDKHIRHNGTVVKMNGEQYSQFLELAGTGLKYGGKNAKERIAEVVKSPAYQQWDDEKKAVQIKAIIESYRKEARKRVKEIDPGMRFLLGLDR